MPGNFTPGETPTLQPLGSSRWGNLAYWAGLVVAAGLLARTVRLGLNCDWPLAVILLVGPGFSFPVLLMGASSVAVGFAQAILIRRRRTVHILSFWLIAGCALAASYAVFFSGPRMTSSTSHVMESFWASAFPPSLLPIGPLLRWIVEIHTGNMLAFPAGGGAFNVLSLVNLLLCILGAVRLGPRRPLLLALMLGPFVVTLAAAAMHLYRTGGRSESPSTWRHRSGFWRRSAAGSVGRTLFGWSDENGPKPLRFMIPSGHGRPSGLPKGRWCCSGSLFRWYPSQWTFVLPTGTDPTETCAMRRERLSAIEGRPRNLGGERCSWWIQTPFHPLLNGIMDPGGPSDQVVLGAGDPANVVKQDGTEWVIIGESPGNDEVLNSLKIGWERALARNIREYDLNDPTTAAKIRILRVPASPN